MKNMRSAAVSGSATCYRLAGLALITILLLTACAPNPGAVISPAPTGVLDVPTSAATFTAVPSAAPLPTVADSSVDCSYLRSTRGSESTVITFVNSSDRDVDVYWVDYQGSEQFRFELRSGVTQKQGTYVTHAWCVRDKTSKGALLAVVASQNEQIATIAETTSSVTVLTAPSSTTAEAGQPDCTSGWTRLRVDGYAEVSQDNSDPNRVREAPDNGAEIIQQIYPGTIVRVLEGPVCVDEFVFWKVENTSIPGGTGWTAEGDENEYYLEPIQ